MGDIGGNDMKHTGRKGTGFPANGHVQLPFQDISDLLMRMLVEGKIAAGLDFNNTQGHVGAVGVVTGEAGGEGFGRLIL